jgi:hypothetical protein
VDTSECGSVEGYVEEWEFVRVGMGEGKMNGWTWMIRLLILVRLNLPIPP